MENRQIKTALIIISTFLIISILGNITQFSYIYLIQQHSKKSYRWIAHTHKIIHKLDELKIIIIQSRSNKSLSKNSLLIKKKLNIIKNLTLDNPKQYERNIKIKKLLFSKKINFKKILFLINEMRSEESLLLKYREKDL